MTTTSQKILRLKEDISNKQKEILRLEEELVQESKVDPKLKEIATILHTVMCNWNHTDGCGWFYSSDADFLNGKSYDKGRYYTWARNIAEHCDADTVLVVLKTIQDNR